MRFAFFGYDYSIDIAQRLIAEGHELLALFTFPCDQAFAFNKQTYALADTLHIPITDAAVTESHVIKLLQEGCEVFLTAGYPRKVPPLPEGQAYGLNIHPALLPRVRGITPAPYIIMFEPQAAGFTVHKLTPEYDAGDILYQESIPVDEFTDVEVLASRAGIRAPQIMAEIFADLPRFWAHAKPQNKNMASFYPRPSPEMRTLDWTQTAAQLRLKGRAFGRYGLFASIQNDVGQQQSLGVFQFSVWEEQHRLAPGILMRSSPREVVVSIRDGYACLKEFQVL